MQAILWPLLSWVFREVMAKFIVMAAVLAAVAWLVPYAIGYITSFIGVAGLNTVFSVLPSGLLWVLHYLRIDYGLPLVLSAVVAKFLIRRIPIIG